MWSNKISTKHHYPPYFFGKRPSKEKVNEMKNYIQHYPSMEKQVIIAHSYMSGTYKSSGGTAYGNLETDKTIALTADELSPLLEERKEKYAPREGYVPCTYCRKQVPEKDAVEYTVIARQYTNMRKTALYCCIDCGAHDQMAHEG